MLLCLALSVLLLLGHSAVRPAAGDCSVPGLVNDLRGACAHGLSHTVQTTQDVKVGLQQAVGAIAKLDETTQQIVTGQQQILQVMQLLQQQLTEVQSRVTAHQEQLTEVQQQLMTPEPSCPADWSRHRQKCYLVSPQKATGDKAASVCAALHPTARLASIHGPASSQHVGQLITDSGRTFIWIGLSRPSDEADWSWSDGTPLNYTSWLSGPTDSSGGNFNCVTADGGGYWYAFQCSVRFGALCQIRLG